MSAYIALIHATRVAVDPIEQTFHRVWPEARTVNLLDESLMRGLDEAGELTPALFERVARLAHFGKRGGAQGILFTCSAFGAAVDAARASLDLPVLKPNEAMLEEALEAGGRIGVFATYKPSLPSLLRELEETAAKKGKDIEVDGRYVPGALEALRAGDPDRHDDLIAQAAGSGARCDVVLLGQFSMARALPAVRTRVRARVLTSPESAVLKLQELLSPSSQFSLFPAHSAAGANGSA